MIRPSLGAALALSLFASAAAASAQNSVDPVTTTPPAGSDRPGTTTPRTGTTTPPTTTTVDPAPRTDDPAPRTVTTPEVVAVPVPVPQQAPPTIELQDQPYPNGFADPNAPFGNDMSVQVRQQEGGGFPWGLLGLLGLAGLLGLRRPRDGYRHVVHSERYDDRGPPRV